jgi:carboxymethylenebutenolidase
MNQHVKNLCARFSKALDGAYAIAPDLYRGKVASKPDEANHLMANLNWSGAVDDIRHAAEFLKEKGCTTIGVIGFCMGGALSIAASAHISDISAGVCFYGIPPAALADPATIKIPVQYHFGDKDMSPGFSDIKACDGLRDKLKNAGKVIAETHHLDEEYKEVMDRAVGVQEFHRYANGDHAFFNEEAPAYPFNEKVAKLAEKHTLSFFKTFLSTN